MKKAFLFLTSTALLLAGCAKVEKEEIVPTPESGKRIVTLNADVDNSGTRVSVDESNGNYSWQAGEEISVLINGSKLTKSSATDVSGNSAKFQVELESGESIGDYAYSPADAAWWNASNSIGLATSHDYVEGATFMPMLGTISTDKKSITFKAVGGVIKLTISNIPSNAESLVFSAYGKRITGTFAISNEKISAEDKTGNDDVTINFAGKQSSTMAFFIPVPTGTYSGFELQFYAAGNTAIADAGKKVQFGGSGLTVNRSEVIVAPAFEFVEPDYSGEWIMVGKKNDDYYACPAYIAGNNIHGVKVTVNSDVVTSDNQSLKMTFTKVSSGTYQGLYTIQDANNWYLYAAGSSSNHLKASEAVNSSNAADYYWSITDVGEGEFSITALKSTNRNILRFNGSDLLFACYAVSSTGSLTGSNVRLYRWSDAVIETPTCVTPAISCGNNIITISCATAGATIYYEIGTTEATTNDPTTSSPVYDPSNKPSITADSYVKAIAIADGYNNSAVAGASVTYTEPSGDVWTLVTDASDLAAGDVIVFACKQYSAVAGPRSGDLLTKVDAVFSSDLNSIVSLPSDALQFTLGGSSPAWTLNCSEGQLYSSAAKKVNFSTDGTGTWNISGNNGNLTVSYENSDYGNLQYNHNGGTNSRFTTYTSTQTAIQIYRKQTAPESSFATVNTSNVDLETSDSFKSTDCSITINTQTVDGAKVGDSNNGGSVRITVPQGTKVLHLHLAGWKDKTVTVKITRSTAGTTVGGTLSLKSDQGVSGNSPYSLTETDASKFYHAVTLSNSETGLADDLTLDISSAGTSGERRFLIWGVNAE